ncbi:hypothetical protein AB5V95_01345 [Metamycoplasma spumans]|uniref:hypothetical protein n=1 Tax=Metamycoplasma spumans TaxID=92406 RepID=UPI0034DCE61B
MLEIVKFSHLLDRDYQGIRVIESNNSLAFLAMLINHENQNNQPSLLINNKGYFVNESIIINPLSKVIDILNFSSKNSLYKMFIKDSRIDQENLIKSDLLSEILNFYTNLVAEDFIYINLDKAKLVKFLFQLNDQKLINKDILFKFFDLSNQLDKQLVIITNFDNINISELVAYTNKFNFIILTNNIWDICNSFEELEVCSIFDNKTFINIDNVSLIKEILMQKFNVDDIEKIKESKILQNAIKSIILD